VCMPLPSRIFQDILSVLSSMPNLLAGQDKASCTGSATRLLSRLWHNMFCWHIAAAQDIPSVLFRMSGVQDSVYAIQ
jgi:hypothetical protein